MWLGHFATLHALSIITQTRIAALPSSFDDADAVAGSHAEKDVGVREQTAFGETTMNCAPRNSVRKSVSMCCCARGPVLRRSS